MKTKVTRLEIQRRAAREFLGIAQRRGQFSRQAAWQHLRDRFHQRPPQKIGQRIDRARNFHRHLPRIAGKDFIATHPAQHYSQRLTRRGRYQITGNRHVNRRLVHVIDQLRQQLGDLGLQHDFMIIGVEFLIDAAGPLDIVGNDVVAQVFRFDSDRVGADPPAVAVMLHHRHDR